MAQTFVARRRGPAGFEQKVCLKRVLPEYAADPALVEQFLDEARLLAHLRHANIVQVYDFGEADGSYFMALELIDGADLEAVQRYLVSQRLTIPAAAAVHICAETLKALHYAHHAELEGEPLHLVHRDISPSNLLLSRAGEVKLADFGIAKSRHRQHKTRAGYTKGKVAYMSPEQVRGGELDGRSDLFAVGIVLHELLTGVHPFDADTDIALLENILRGTRPDLAKLSPPLRPELVRLIDALLATDPAERPDTASDALLLVPQLDQQFRVERNIGEMVTACVAARAAREARDPATYLSTPPAARTSEAARPDRTSERPGMTATMPMPQRSESQPPATPRAVQSFNGTTTEMLGLSESVGTDALLAAQGPRASSNHNWLIALVGVCVLVMLGLFAYRYSRSRLPVIAVPTPTEQAAPVERLGVVDGSAPVTQPAAAKPVEPEQQEASENDEPEREPVILHNPGPDTEAPRRTVHEPRERKVRRVESDEATRAPKVTQHAEPVAPAAPPPQEKQEKPVEAPRKHRAGISISSDDF